LKNYEPRLSNRRSSCEILGMLEGGEREERGRREDERSVERM
jgi:hypothetical protein